MLAQKTQALISSEDEFLKTMKDSRESLTIFLINGVKLKGIVIGYDDTCIILEREDAVQMIYKNAISTMMPLNDRF